MIDTLKTIWPAAVFLIAMSFGIAYLANWKLAVVTFLVFAIAAPIYAWLLSKIHSGCKKRS